MKVRTHISHGTLVTHMIERLQRALPHIDDLPLQEQELVAQQIAAWSAKKVDWHTLFGSVKLPDDFDEVDVVLKARHEMPLTFSST